MKSGLSGKKVIITGASRGLGSVCAMALAAHGASLVLMARTEKKLEEVRMSCQNPEKHLTIGVDLTNTEQLRKAIGRATEFLGEIDVVLHVAGGGLGLREPLLSSGDLIKLFTLNVAVAAEINRIVLPGMIKRKSGNLVHVASIASGEATASVGYNTAKAALAAYVKSLGREIAGYGVVATGILPGGFYAPENSWERLKAQKPKVVENFIKERLPRGFLGRAEELIPMILLLCSDAASMMGGCLVPIDAGEGKAYTVND
ncbi:SDR family oxidoreductase [bacterium]|nr:SDR family oxidoreductase [bacterium]